MLESGDRAIYIDPNTLEHRDCIIVGKITEYSTLIDLGYYTQEVENWELREYE